MGTPLLEVNGRDNTPIYGFLRDLLRLRQTLGINKGVLVIGREAYNVTHEENIQKISLFLREFGVPIIYDPESKVLDINLWLLPKVTCIITRAKGLLQLEKENILFIIPNSSEKFDFISSDDINAKMGINQKQIPTLLSLTEGPKLSTITKGQAIRLIELYGDLEDIYKNLSMIDSALIKKKLTENKDTYLKRYLSMKITKNKVSLQNNLKSMIFDVNNDKNVKLLESYRFYSLIRTLNLPTNFCMIFTKNDKKFSSYKAVIDKKGLKELEYLILSSEYCAIDTESNDKDPQQATLFGVSFSVNKGEAFYIPLIENDLKDITQRDVILFLKRILEKPLKFVGHNIKYDYLILRRYGIKLKEIHFDTMLAAYDCFGDWDFFNLSFLSKKLLDKEIKSYKEIVKNDQTFLDLPFRKIVDHACEDADITLQLYYFLKKELERKKIAGQYFQDTIPLLKKLGELEYNGIPINLYKLKKLRNTLLEKALILQKSIWEKMEKEFDLDSQKDIAIILKEIPSLKELILGQKITLSLLERLAIIHSVPRLILNYKRVRKQIIIIDTIAKAITGNKLRPTFNQIKYAYGQLSSVRPSIFEKEGCSDLKLCFNKNFQGFFKDSKRSMRMLENLSKDTMLHRDRLLKNNNIYIKNHPLLKGLDFDELLLSIIIGLSDSKLSKRFLVDQLTASTIRHELEVRYSILFQWIENYRKLVSKQGFASIRNKRKYFDGLKSSNIEKRGKALNFAIRWLISY
ncbi:MAG: hypothetical protein ACMUJM_25375 [bacterium]